jgi:hypothetical protein
MFVFFEWWKKKKKRRRSLAPWISRKNAVECTLILFRPLFEKKRRSDFWNEPEKCLECQYHEILLHSSWKWDSDSNNPKGKCDQTIFHRFEAFWNSFFWLRYKCVDPNRFFFVSYFTHRILSKTTSDRRKESEIIDFQPYNAIQKLVFLSTQIFLCVFCISWVPCQRHFPPRFTSNRENLELFSQKIAYHIFLCLIEWARKTCLLNSLLFFHVCWSRCKKIRFFVKACYDFLQKFVRDHGVGMSSRTESGKKHFFFGSFFADDTFVSLLNWFSFCQGESLFSCTFSFVFVLSVLCLEVLCESILSLLSIIFGASFVWKK